MGSDELPPRWSQKKEEDSHGDGSHGDSSHGDGSHGDGSHDDTHGDGDARGGGGGMLRHGQHQLGELHVGPDGALILHEPIEGRSEKRTVRHNHLQNTRYHK